jgi:hypothetical protein
MNAQQAKQESGKARNNAISSIGPRIYSRIQDRVTKGKNHLLCRSNKLARQQLKSDGFGVIFLGLITIVWW